MHSWICGRNEEGEIEMDSTNPVVQLCIVGDRAEFEHRLEDARLLYRQAGEARQDDYDACIAAHDAARFQDAPKESLRWNRLALQLANAVSVERVKDFYPSLYLNLGRAYEVLGNSTGVQKY